MPLNLPAILTVCAVSFGLFAFGFLAGVTVQAPWGAGPAATCGLGALATAWFLVAWLRGHGTRSASRDVHPWIDRLSSPLAYGIAAALAAAAAYMLVSAPAWTGYHVFWPACFGLVSAGFTAFGDARARAETGAPDEADDASDHEDAGEGAGDVLIPDPVPAATA